MARGKDNTLFEVFQQANGSGKDFLRELVREVLQQVMEAEIAEHLGAAPYERTDARRGYRNGYKPRTLNTRVGTLDLLVPQDREGIYHTQIFERYSRSEKALCLAIHEMIVNGVSTRKIARIARELGVQSLSRSTASKMAAIMDQQVRAWLTKPLDKEEYPYLVVDARYEKVREGGRVVSKGVLIPVGIDSDGYRDILGVYVADSESETSWGELFADLKRRGLDGVRLVVSDRHKGLVAAIFRYFDGASWQRCTVHYMRNLANKLKRKDQKSFLAMLKRVWEQRTLEEAKECVRKMTEELSHTRPDLVEWLEETIEDTLAIYALPPVHRRQLKSTNMLERVNQELKRRTRVIRIFPNAQSCMRTIATLCMEYSEEWTTGKRYLNMEEIVSERKNENHIITEAILQKI